MTIAINMTTIAFKVKVFTGNPIPAEDYWKSATQDIDCRHLQTHVAIDVVVPQYPTRSCHPPKGQDFNLMRQCCQNLVKISMTACRNSKSYFEYDPSSVRKERSELERRSYAEGLRAVGVQCMAEAKGSRTQHQERG